MNSTNTSKQLATQEACNTEISSWGSQRSESQCRANYQKNKTSTQTKEQNQQKEPNKTQNQQNINPPPDKVNSTNKSLLQPQ